MPYNLGSPHSILEAVQLEDLLGWFFRELTQVPTPAERHVLEAVATDLDSFVRWAKDPLLLWSGCDRIPPTGERQKYHSYPPEIRKMASDVGLVLDRRPNGPAIASFLLAGGERPARFGSSNAWSIHHLYSGKFPYFERRSTTHAAKECAHFTQSAGLIAAHPVADAMVDEFPFFAWLVRAHAFDRFGYDPDGVFSPVRDQYGFVTGRSCRIVNVGA